MNKNIKCPKCGEVFDVENVLAADIEKKFQDAYQEKLNISLSKMEAEKKKLAEEQLNFEDKKKKENEFFLEKVKNEKIKIEADLNEKITKTISADFENKILLMQQQQIDSAAKLKEAREKELEYLQKEQALKNKEDELEIILQKKLQAERALLTDNIRNQEQTKNALKEDELNMRMKELEKQLEDQKKMAAEMQRKADQGSMQLQGEVQELALEELLKTSFPFDQIDEVGKGVKGADCIMTIRNQNRQDCGKIIFESKRTENFAADWIEKLKVDMVAQKADIAVIVTKTMPKDLDQFGEKNGVYICTFKEVKSLTIILRNAIIKINEARKSQENKGEKMETLYHYLTSQEFVGNWNAIREGFRNLRGMLQKEREDFEKNWKKKEKQIDLIIQNSLHITGSIEGIAGSDAINMDLQNDNVDNLLEN